MHKRALPLLLERRKGNTIPLDFFGINSFLVSIIDVSGSMEVLEQMAG
jgi:hypothetical protein